MSASDRAVRRPPPPPDRPQRDIERHHRRFRHADSARRAGQRPRGEAQRVVATTSGLGLSPIDQKTQVWAETETA